MNKTFCDVCGKPAGQGSTFSMNIGNFHNKKQINVRMEFYQGLPSGYGPWGDIDLCRSCIEECVELTVTELFRQKNEKGKLENHTQIHHDFKETE